MSNVMLAAFRHDTHKFTGESHNNAREEFAGVRVNQSFPKVRMAMQRLSRARNRNRNRPFRPTITITDSRCWLERLPTIPIISLGQQSKAR